METFGTVMDSCLAVEQDLDKAISKFNAIHGQTSQSLQDIIDRVEEIKNEISKHPPDQVLTPEEVIVLNDLAATVKQSVFQMSTEHRELHATVSRVGKSIDRHFIADYGSVAPKAESFCSDANRPYMEQAIAQHLYRQGLEEEGDTFVAEAGVTGAERSCSFAVLQRCAAALAAGEPAPALQWAAEREPELEHSPLPFVLHRMMTLKLGSEVGVVAAIEYARCHFPRYAARHERRIQACVCALAWCGARGAGAGGAGAGVGGAAGPAPPPAAYRHLLDAKQVGAEAAELFISEACALLQLAPLSPLAGAVLAGARVLPARCELRARLVARDVLAAWCDDDLPLEIDLGEEGGGYHSVFACPILRQQASEHNPPMRLQCGHVISRDALHKLAMGVKFKCPYCPMEQSASDARQIYFS